MKKGLIGVVIKFEMSTKDNACCTGVAKDIREHVQRALGVNAQNLRVRLSTTTTTRHIVEG